MPFLCGSPGSRKFTSQPSAFADATKWVAWKATSLSRLKYLGTPLTGQSCLRGERPSASMTRPSNDLRLMMCASIRDAGALPGGSKPMSNPAQAPLK